MDIALSEGEADAEKERSRAWMQFLIQSFTAPSFGGADPSFEQAKKEFIDVIKPKPALNEPTKIYQWDEEVLKRYKQKQKGG